MSTDQLLQDGIAAAQSGDLAQARYLLYQVVRANPRSELGWQWLAYSIEVPEKQAECFRRVLLINPKNAYARQQLDALRARGITPPAPAARRPAARSGKKMDPKLIGGLAVLALLCLCAVGGGVLLVNGGLLQASSTVAGEAAPPPEVVLTLPPDPTPVPTPNYIPIQGQEPCTFDIPEGAKVECYAVVVPENRAGNPQDTIRLAVVIYRSSSPSPAPDPIIFLQGGPGMAGIPWTLDAYEDIIAPLISERDFITFDPRGTGRSIPTLDCNELQTTNLRDIQGLIVDRERQAYYSGALQVCREKLSRSGVDLSAYTSAAYAADVRDILTALGYQQANIYAASYGTRVAQIILRDYPQVVRSVILDSVVPLDAKVLEQAEANSENALQALFSACAADLACAAAYPDLKGMYQSARQTLDETPLRTTTSNIPQEGTLNVLINGQMFAETITWLLRNAETVPDIPLVIARTHDGNYDPLRFMLTMPYNTISGINLGTYVSVSCHEQVYTATTESMGLIVDETCDLWGVTPLLPDETEPVRSGLPVLLMSGRFDPVTPPVFASRVAANLGSASLLEFPAQGHVPTGSTVSDCARQIMLDFIRNPNAPVKSTCLADEQKVDFILPYTGAEPVSLEDVEDRVHKLVTKIPAGWEKLEDGVYVRLHGFNDIVQVGVLQGSASKEIILDNLKDDFNNGAGFDGEPAFERTEKIGALEWSFYKAESSSIILDMAFARNGKQTIWVTLVSYPDERTALYRMVFLPVIEATKPLR